MNVPIIMPQMGQSVAEGTIVTWFKNVGDRIEADEKIVEIEGDKISIEVESPTAGVLGSRLKQEGESASVGDIIGTIIAEGGDETETVEKDRPHHGGSTDDQVLVSRRPAGRPVNMELPDISGEWLSPMILRLAVQNNVSMKELSAIRGTGRNGRITRNDMLMYLARRPAGAGSAPAPSNGLADRGDLESFGKVVPMTSIRKTIADHMVQSIHTSAHVTMVHAVDMTSIVALRNQIKDEFFKKYNVKMTYTAVMIYVLSRVLKTFPIINGAVSGSNIVMRKDINIGCAVALEDESLVVPVVKGVDHKSFPEIAQNLENLIKLARGKSLSRGDIEDGTFTISNFGAFGSLIGTPIINQPQVAILGMGAVFKAPVVVDGEICVRDQMYLSFTFDHRVIDGAMGGRFLNAIQKTTEALTAAELDVKSL